jgi:hypothetical protein
MDPLLAVIVFLALGLLAVTVYMEWLGVLSLVTFRSGRQHSECGHPKLTAANDLAMCWRCRHQRLDHALHVPHR